MSQDKRDRRRAFRGLLQRAAIDYAFRRQLLEDPHRAIEQFVGVTIPAGLNIRVIERGPGVHALVVLPDFHGPPGKPGVSSDTVHGPPGPPHPSSLRLAPCTLDEMDAQGYVWTTQQGGEETSPPLGPLERKLCRSH